MSAKKQSNWKNIITTIAKLGFAVGLIYWLLQKGHLDLAVLAQLLRPDWMIAGFSMVLVVLMINNFRWVLLLRGQGLTTKYWHALQLTFIGMFFNFFMPGGVGGDLVKGFYICRNHPERKMAAATSVIVDRLVGLWAMVFWALVAVTMDLEVVLGNHELSILSVGVIGVFLALSLLLMFSLSIRAKKSIHWIIQKVPGGQRIGHLYEVIHSYRNSREMLYWGITLSFISQFITICFFIFVGTALKVDMPFSAYFFVVPLGLIAMSIPIAPAGIGLGQAAYLKLFELYTGHMNTVGPTAVTAQQAISLGIGLVGAYYYLKIKKPQMNEATT